ncbi:hypothetical protein [Methylobacterium pseudosasicola]|uniref:Uncharacterized protein n=1 Tax=Methylobacterium pseudosasicola TaxID=582667 RepID=A0A1I4VJE9_9HYPH|nr:hypothetical protein [Methylobacterium pseudosasicola]SFN01230.1 hypothetical protein SAMN05192568_11043 [Methylobacterium pseudosasicola]
MNSHVDPTTLATASSPLLPFNKWICSGFNLHRGDMDLINEGTKLSLVKVRFKYRMFVERNLMRHLEYSEYIVLSAILAITLSFSKLIEKIPMDVFAYGMREEELEDFAPILDDDGMPYFEGAGLTPKTIRAALKGLKEKGIISAFTLPGKKHKEIYAYSAMSLRSIIAVVAQYSSKEDRSAFLKSLDSNPFLFMSMARDPVSELEERFIGMFPDGVGFINFVKERNRDAFMRTQARLTG